MRFKQTSIRVRPIRHHISQKIHLVFIVHTTFRAWTRFCGEQIGRPIKSCSPSSKSGDFLEQRRTPAGSCYQSYNGRNPWLDRGLANGSRSERREDQSGDPPPVAIIRQILTPSWSNRSLVWVNSLNPCPMSVATAHSRIVPCWQKNLTVGNPFGLVSSGIVPFSCHSH